MCCCSVLRVLQCVDTCPATAYFNLCCSALQLVVQRVAVRVAGNCSMCCSTLQYVLQHVEVCVAAHCSMCCSALKYVMQRVAVCIATRCTVHCSALQDIPISGQRVVCCSVLQRVAVFCNVLHKSLALPSAVTATEVYCAAKCCNSVLQCVAVCYSVL